MQILDAKSDYDSRIMDAKLKLTNLFEYLKKVAKARSGFVKNIDRYENYVWLDELTKLKNCKLSLILSEINDEPSDVFLEITKPHEPEKPILSESCREWLKESFDDFQIPTLLDEIVVDKNGEKCCLRLIDHPEIVNARNKYVKSWKQWRNEHSEWEQCENAYENLYSIYKKYEKDKDGLELVIGVGLFQNLKTSYSFGKEIKEKIRRHLMTLTVDLDQINQPARLVLKATKSILKPDLEIIEDDIDKATVDKIEKLIEADSSLTEANLAKIFETILNSTYADGEYKGYEKIESVQKPTINLAPALILRKKSNRGAINAINEIQSQISEQCENFSDNLLKLVSQGHFNEANPEINGQLYKTNEEEIFFPKVSNNEQRAIVHKLNASSGVVVQGPPGTGKSHTIANLICHLLADGQRVLVTAKTSTALNVLRNLIPEEVRNLCISKMGNSVSEHKILEASVSSILHKSETWNDERENKNMAELIQELQKYRERKARLENKFRDILKAETDSVSIVNGAYTGTLTDIVEKINDERQKYEWFKDYIDEKQWESFDPTELYDILVSIRKLNNKKDILSLPVLDIPQPSAFSRVVAESQKLDLMCKMYNKNSEIEYRLDTLSIENLNKLLKYTKDIQKLKMKILSYDDKYPWLKHDVEKIFSGITISAPSVNGIHLPDIKQAQEVVHYELEYKNDLPRKRIYDDAKALKEYIENGGRIKLVNLWMPKTIRSAVHTFKTVLINKRRCSQTIEDLNLIIKAIDLEQSIENTVQLLGDIAIDAKGRFPLISKLIKLKEITKILSDLNELQNMFNDYKALLKSAVDDEHLSIQYDLKEIEETCYKLISKAKKDKSELFFSHLMQKFNQLKDDKLHTVILSLYNDIEQRSAKDYARDFEILNNLYEEKKQLKLLSDKITKIREVMPNFVADVLESCDASVWDLRIKDIEKAVHWRQTKSYIEDHIKSAKPSEIKKAIHKLESEINNLVARLASQKAWQFCIQKLTGKQKKNIELWRQTSNKIGKGTGKYVNRYIREAKNYFDIAKEAIPAWIMPLYAVWDNIQMRQNSFDVVIVDEASQCGVDAIPLLYLGKKIIIVGDDKQMSPDNVGLDREKTYRWLDEYLKDFGDDKSIYDVDKSFFDIGNIIFNTDKIVLREHFRCMPEIIRFSNENWYSYTPLIPLRQYGSDRIPPLINKFVDNGYTENGGASIINRPEATAIVNFVSEICANEKYKDKTIGILALQGKGQIDLIEKELLRKIGEIEITKHKIKCGSFEHFQGDERDIMIMSMVVGVETKFTAISARSYQQRYNVAMSRAKDQVVLFHSVRSEDLSTEDLRRKLLDFFQAKIENEVSGVSLSKLEKMANDIVARKGEEKPFGTKFDSWFELDVAIELMKRGYRIISQYEVAGRRIDIVIEGDQSCLAVECDGDRWHGADRYEDDMKRQRQLERNGWEFYRIPSSAFYYDKEDSLRKLWPLLQERGIFPVKQVSC